MSGARVVSGWFALVVLYTVITRADKAAGVLGYITVLTNRLGDPSLALIPNRASTSSAASGTTTSSSSSTAPTSTGGPSTSTYKAPIYSGLNSAGSTVVAPGQTLIPSGGPTV